MIGQETDGSVTPIDLGLAVKEEDFLGRRSFQRVDTARPLGSSCLGAPGGLPAGVRAVGKLPVSLGCAGERPGHDRVVAL